MHYAEEFLNEPECHYPVALVKGQVRYCHEEAERQCPHCRRWLCYEHRECDCTQDR